MKGDAKEGGVFAGWLFVRELISGAASTHPVAAPDCQRGTLLMFCVLPVSIAANRAFRQQSTRNFVNFVHV